MGIFKPHVRYSHSNWKNIVKQKTGMMPVFLIYGKIYFGCVLLDSDVDTMGPNLYGFPQLISLSLHFLFVVSGKHTTSVPFHAA